MNSPPQQKPAAPIAETPLLFRASRIGFASSNALSYQSKNTIQKLTILEQIQIAK